MAWLALLGGVVFPCGCTSPDKKFTYLGKAELQDYRDTQLTIDEPEDPRGVDSPTLVTMKPRTVADRSRDDIWNVTLDEAIHLALTNNKIARTRNEFQSPGNPVLSNPEGVSSVFDPAIRESGFLFGNRGVESSLSAFDPVLAGNATFGNSSVIQNNPVLSGGIPAGRTLFQDTAAVTTSLTKNMAYGATTAVSQSWNYQDTNQPFQLFPSLYTGDILFNYTQPLLAGAGTEFNRISGPLATNIQGVSGLNQGVIIARINTDISLADFEVQVRNMVHDVEDLYWELYLAYRNYDSLVTARDTALKIWQTVSAKSRSGLPGGGQAEEAQSRDTYYEARARTESALAGPPGKGGDQGIYGLELQLRRICGLPSNDGRIIRPADEPTVAQVLHNWDLCLATAFARREELRKQRWIVKSVELQLRAANNLARPQLNFVSSYQLNGFGQRLFGDNGPPGSAGQFLTNYNRSLYAADQTQWNVGMQFSMPLGLRNAHAQVRNTELRLMKAYAVLDAQELEIGHELAATFQSMDYWYQNTQTNYNRREAAAENLAAITADFEVDRKSIDQFYQAQNRVTIADIAFFRSLVEYNKSLAELQMRQGTLLEYNNIQLAEAQWVPEAKVDATRRAWARSFAFDVPAFDPVHQEPEPMVPNRGSSPVGNEPLGPFEPAEELPPPRETPTDQPFYTVPDGSIRVGEAPRKPELGEQTE